MYRIGNAAVCNMEKSPVPYAPHHKYTIYKQGSKMVKAKQSSLEVKVKAALMISKVGQKLPPFMIF